MLVPFLTLLGSNTFNVNAGVPRRSSTVSEGAPLYTRPVTLSESAH